MTRARGLVRFLRGKTGVTSPDKHMPPQTAQTRTKRCSFPGFPPTQWRPYSPESTTHARFRTSLPCTPTALCWNRLPSRSSKEHRNRLKPVSSHAPSRKSFQTYRRGGFALYPLVQTSTPTPVGPAARSFAAPSNNSATFCLQVEEWEHLDNRAQRQHLGKAVRRDLGGGLPDQGARAPCPPATL